MEYTMDFAITLNKILSANQEALDQAVFLKDLPDLMNKVAEGNKCICNDGNNGNDNFCFPQEHITIVTSCADSQEPVQLPLESAVACGAVSSSGVEAVLPAPKYMIDAPEPQSLIVVIAYAVDSLFYELEEVAITQNVSTPPYEVSIVGARPSGTFADGQELVLRFPVDSRRTNVSQAERKCAYYVPEGTLTQIGWHTDGMTLDTDLTTDAVTVCRSTHLTVFGVLTTVPQVNGTLTIGGTAEVCEDSISPLLYLGIGICIVCLVAKIALFILRPPNRTPANRIIYWLSWAMLFAIALVLVAVHQLSGTVGKAVAICLHVAMLFSAYWMLNTSVHLYQSIIYLREKGADNREKTNIRRSRSLALRKGLDDSLEGDAAKLSESPGVWSLPLYVGIGVAIPLLILMGTMAGWMSSYGDNGAATWLAEDAVWAFVVPAVLALVVHLALLAQSRENLRKFAEEFNRTLKKEKSITERAPATVLSEEASVEHTINTAKEGLQYAAVLAVMMTGLWTVGTMLLLYRCTDTWQVLFALVAAVFGVYILLLHVAADPILEHAFNWLHNHFGDRAPGPSAVVASPYNVDDRDEYPTNLTDDLGLQGFTGSPAVTADGGYLGIGEQNRRNQQPAYAASRSGFSPELPDQFTGMGAESRWSQPQQRMDDYLTLVNSRGGRSLDTDYLSMSGSAMSPPPTMQGWGPGASPQQAWGPRGGGASTRGPPQTTAAGRNDLPSLLEVFRLFERLCQRVAHTSHNVLIMKSASHDLCDQLPVEFPHYVVDDNGVLTTTSGTQILSRMDSDGNHIVGVLVFIKTVEAMERQRKPNEPPLESLNAVELVRVFSALNGLSDQAFTERELSQTVDTSKFSESLPPLFQTYDSAENARGASRHIISRLPPGSGGRFTLRQYFSTAQVILREGWSSAGPDQMSWHPDQITQPCEMYIIVAAYQALSMVKEAPLAGNLEQMNVAALLAQLQAGETSGLSVDDFLRVLVEMKNGEKVAGVRAPTAAPVAAPLVPAPAVDERSSGLQPVTTRLSTAVTAPNPSLSPHRAPRERRATPKPVSTNSIAEMYKLFGELSPYQDAANAHVLSMEDITSPPSLELLTKSLPTLFGQTSSDGSVQKYATADEVLSKLDKNGDGYLTVIEFIKAAKTMVPADFAGGLVGPGDVRARPPAVPTVIPAPKILQAREHKTPGTTIDTLLADTSAGQKENARDVADVSEGVPEGWVPTLDPATGQTYYYSPALQITQWERPVVPLITSPAEIGTMAPPVVPHAPTSADIFTFGRRPSYRGAEQDDPLLKAFSVLHLGSPDEVLTAHELAQTMHIDDLQQELPAAYGQFDKTSNGQVHAAEILRLLVQNGKKKVSVTEFLRMARAVRVAAGADKPGPSHFNPTSSSKLQGFGI
jgi:Ca2+-binding EF-hand superfamily protein